KRWSARAGGRSLSGSNVRKCAAIRSFARSGIRCHQQFNQRLRTKRSSLRLDFRGAEARGENSTARRYFRGERAQRDGATQRRGDQSASENFRACEIDTGSESKNA